MALSTSAIHRPHFIATTVAFVVLSVIVLVFTYFYAVNLVFWDEWDYYKPLWTNGNLKDLFFWQHGPHRMGVGYWIIAAIAKLTNWNSVAQAFGSAVFLIATPINYYILKLRLTGRTDFLDLIFPVLGLSLVHYEVLIAGNIALNAFPLFGVSLFSLVYISAIRPWLKTVLLTLLTVAIMFSGFGVFWCLIHIGLLIYEILKKNSNRILNVVAILFLGYCLYLMFGPDYRREAGAICENCAPPKFYHYIIFALSGFAKLFAFYQGVPLAIQVLLALFFFLSAISFFSAGSRSRIRSALHPLLPALILFSFMFISAAALGRAGLSSTGGRESRYMCYLVPAVFAIYMWVIKAGGVPQPSAWYKRPAIWFAVLLFSTYPYHAAFNYGHYHGFYFFVKAKWRESYRAHQNLEQADRDAKGKIFPDYNSPAFQEGMRFLKARNANLFRN